MQHRLGTRSMSAQRAVGGASRKQHIALPRHATPGKGREVLTARVKAVEHAHKHTEHTQSSDVLRSDCANACAPELCAQHAAHEAPALISTSPATLGWTHIRRPRQRATPAGPGGGSAPRVPVQVEQVHVAGQAVRQHAAGDAVAVQAAAARARSVVSRDTSDTALCLWYARRVLCCPDSVGLDTGSTPGALVVGAY